MIRYLHRYHPTHPAPDPPPLAPPFQPPPPITTSAHTLPLNHSHLHLHYAPAGFSSPLHRGRYCAPDSPPHAPQFKPLHFIITAHTLPHLHRCRPPLSLPPTSPQIAAADCSSMMTASGNDTGSRTDAPSDLPRLMAKREPSETLKHAPPESPSNDGLLPLTWLCSSM